LRELTQETVIIGKRQDDAVIYLGVWEGFQSIRYNVRPGDYKAWHFQCDQGAAGQPAGRHDAGLA
jgi:hypothetical protein